MVDEKDMKDDKDNVENVEESETLDVASDVETVTAEESVESTPKFYGLDDSQTAISDDAVVAAEEASREGFSSGQVTAENYLSKAEQEIAIAQDNQDAAKGVSADDGEVDGMAAYFDRPDELMQAAAFTRLAKYTKYDAFSPFPIHGMDHAMGLGPSWIPWVTFGAGTAGFLTANALQFGMMSYDWPMIVGGKSFAPWPAFVPIMFELTVLMAGITTVIVMLAAAGCFRKPRIIDKDITNDRFVLWISAEDKTFDIEQVKAFMESLDPVEVRTITKGA